MLNLQTTGRLAFVLCLLFAFENRELVPFPSLAEVMAANSHQKKSKWRKKRKSRPGRRRAKSYRRKKKRASTRSSSKQRSSDKLRDRNLQSLSTAPTAPPKLTPLQQAIVDSNRQAVDQILQKNPELLNPSYHATRFPLMDATITNRPNMAKLLLKKGAKVDTKLGNGLTPLGYAVAWGLLDMASVLLQYKADPNQKVAGATLLDVATAMENKEMQELLITYGAKGPPVVIPYRKNPPPWQAPKEP